MDLRISPLDYDDVFTREAVGALHAMAALDDRRLDIMQAKLDRRAARARERRRITFLNSTSTIEGTAITVDAVFLDRMQSPPAKTPGMLVSKSAFTWI